MDEHPVMERSDHEPDFAPPVAPEPRPRRSIGFGWVLMAALLGGLIGASAVGGILLMADDLSLTGLRETTPTVDIAPLRAPEQPIEAVAARVVPSVVNIAVEQQGDDVFGQSVSGNGSGVILRQDGYILTNYHVIQGATRILVRFGTEDETARVVGADPTSDLAVIKVERTGLPAATIGRSGEVLVGETVIAIGSPFGLDKTVTAGIVSALHRTNLAETGDGSGVTAYTNLIQTDAPINPGNSGGALVDLTGAVIGINTLIQSPSGQLGTPQSAGIGFAIPIDYAKSVADQLIAGKKVAHPLLGISPVTITESFARQYGLPVTSGALVQQVSPGSPADQAGIRVADVIIRIDDTEIETSQDVFAAVRSREVGQEIEIELVREDKRITVTAKLASDASDQ